MQINNQLSVMNSIAERPTQLNEGEVYRATIKERKGNNEAIIQIRGKDFPVKFESEVPKEDRVTVEIGPKKGDNVHVRTLAPEKSPTAGNTVEQQTTSSVLKSFGISPITNELQQATQHLLDKGVPITKEGVQQLQQFIDKAKFPMDDKLQTIQALASKRLAISSAHLLSIHEALHGRPLNEVLTNIARETQPNIQIEAGRQPAGQAPSLNATETAEMIRMQLQALPEALKHLAKAEAEAIQLEKLAQERFSDNPVKKAQLEQLAKDKLLNVLNQANLDEKTAFQDKPNILQVIKAAEINLQQEADFSKAIAHLQKNVSILLNDNHHLNELLNSAIESAEQLAEKGREMGARQELMNVLKEILNASTINSSFNQTSGYAGAEQLNVQLNSKAVAVTTITQQMAEMTATFKTIQRDIARNLDVVDRFIDIQRSKATAQVTPMLETTIKKLDNLILKGEMMLFADMKTEKQLMQASSQLAEAKKLLAKGNYQEAQKIVQEVKSQVERVHFQPSETKVKHYTDLRGLLDQPSAKQQVTELVRQQYQPVVEPSARQVFEMIRQLGLNRDSEIGQLLANNREQSNDQQQNMKNALLQLLKEEDSGRISQLANQALNNITGQQLLSKSDPVLQNMFFNLPFLLQEKTENLQVYINSRNEGEKVDWENCSLYFLIETPKLGEVGIQLNVADRKLAVTIKNDKEDFQTKMEPLVGSYVDVLSEIGYHISGIQFQKIKTETAEQAKLQNEPTKELQQPLFTEKGFDYKI